MDIFQIEMTTGVFHLTLRYPLEAAEGWGARMHSFALNFEGPPIESGEACMPLRQAKTRSHHARPGFAQGTRQMIKLYWNRSFTLSRKPFWLSYSLPVAWASNCRSRSFCFSLMRLGTSTRTVTTRSPFTLACRRVMP